MAAIAPDLRWDFPLRLLGALHWLVLGGEASWDGIDGALERHAETLARFTAEQKVQTNEVGRAWALLPGLLSLGERRIDLVEPGASAGLLLCLDRYRYRYAAGSWGDGDLELQGQERGRLPEPLLNQPLEIVRRRGIDLSPVDVSGDDGARLLRAFVWPGQETRFERLDAAIDVARATRPELIRGDYLDRLSEVLADRGDGLTVVLTSLTTAYLDEERYQTFLRVLAAAGARAPLAWLSLDSPRHGPQFDGAALDLTVWPGGETRRLAHVDYHAAWLDWL